MALEAPARLPGPEPPAAADVRPQPLCAGGRRGARRLCPGRRAATASPRCILIGTGSEVSLCIDAYEELQARTAFGARRQHAVLGAVRAAGRAYRDSVLPPDVTARVSVEMGSVIGWDRYVGATGAERRHAHVRRLGAAQGPADEIRLHAGEGAGGRANSRSKGQRAADR